MNDNLLFFKILLNNLPAQHVDVAMFRMASGHDCLQSYLHRIGLANSPQYPLCMEGDGTANHLAICRALATLIIDRPLIEDIARVYWETQRLMDIQPRMGVNCRKRFSLVFYYYY